MNIPICCKQCEYLDWEYDEFKDKTYYYCILNIWFPTKKKTCKKQAKRAQLEGFDEQKENN